MIIGLVPVSAKPYHIGHHQMVLSACQECHTVILIVSLKDRKRKNEFPILGPNMAKIWKYHLEKIMPNNCRVSYREESPIQRIYDILGGGEETKQNVLYRIYCGEEDVDNFKNFEKYYPYLMSNKQIELSLVPRYHEISGTKMRQYLQNKNYEEFSKFIPQECNATEIWNELSSANE